MDYDVVVIGSGFGGSVAALRLAEKGYGVAVLEAGRRFADADLPRTSWNARRFLWAPRLGCLGIQRIDLLRHGREPGTGRQSGTGRESGLGREPGTGRESGMGRESGPGGRSGIARRPAARSTGRSGRSNAGASVLVLSGAGVGGGSLVYANTLYEPLPEFYDDPQWRNITDWRAELAPHYARAKRMLGVTTYPVVTDADRAMRAVADRMGVGATHHPTPVGVFLGRPGELAADPYFGGAGPARTGCTHCGSCMTGCRVGAKNTLVKNYLWLAERLGAQVLPLTTVTAVRPAPSGAGYEIDTVRTGGWPGRRRTLTAGQVVFAAGALGTQRLLHRMAASGALPHISPRLGALTRTNSESIVGASVPLRAARRRRLDYTHGVAITSSFYPDPHTHIEPVRYGPGSNAMGLLQSALTDGGPRRPLRWLLTLLRRPLLHGRLLVPREWSRRTIIALVMQSLDNSLTLRYRRTWYGRGRLVGSQGHGAPTMAVGGGGAAAAPSQSHRNPTWIPAGNRAVRLLAEEIGGIPGGSVTEAFNVPMTAHILGGAVIGASRDDGVVDAYHRVFGHPGLHVVDGAAVSANLGVNPSLTITAQAERAMSFWPNRGGPDPRPPLGSPYVRVSPVPADNPAVPAGAPAAS